MEDRGLNDLRALRLYLPRAPHQIGIRMALSNSAVYDK